MTYYTVIESPLGPLTLTSDGRSLTRVYLPEAEKRAMRAPRGRAAIRDGWIADENASPLAEAKRQLTAYFEGRLREFDLPLAPAGPEFHQRVWTELARIPYGITTSYGEIARRIGQPGSARAVGLANGANPIAIILPCHRVIGASGKLVGYGGGLPRKAALLLFETGVLATGPQPFPSVE